MAISGNGRVDSGSRQADPRTLLVAYGLGLLAFLGLCLVQLVGSTDVFQDVAVTTREPFYVGLGNELGVLLWTATVVVCLYTWVGLGPGRVRATSGCALVAIAGLTTILAAADLLILHERVFLRESGMPEHVSMGIYGILGLLSLAVARRVIADSPDRALFVSVMALFAIAIGLDVLEETPLTFTGMRGIP